jgi:hypothetical protein
MYTKPAIESQINLEGELGEPIKVRPRGSRRQMVPGHSA